ncbi:hypothetical protein ACPBEI_07290 [Latilactobacillus sakei]
MKVRTILTANVTSRTGTDDEFKINIPKKTELKELEFVLIQTMYWMVCNYAEVNDLQFEKALEQYARAVMVQVGVMKDLTDGQA